MSMRLNREKQKKVETRMKRQPQNDRMKVCCPILSMFHKKFKQMVCVVDMP